MRDQDRTREQLIQELAGMRQRISQLEGVAAAWHKAQLYEQARQEIAERARAEEQLRDTSELLEKIFATTHLLIAYMDADFNFIRVNRAYAEADDRGPEFFVGKNHFDLYPNEENEAIFRRVVETGKPASFRTKPFEYEEHPERGVTYWDWDLVPVKDASGRVDEVVLGLVNVTERVKTEEELRKHRAHLEELVKERTAELTRANEQLRREIAERKRAEEALRRAHDELEAKVQERTAELSRLNEALQAEIAQRKQTEETLRGERDFAQAVIETAQAIVLVLDTEGRIVHFNPYMEEISGYQLQKVHGKDWFSTFLPERDRDWVRALFLQAVGDIQTRGNVNPIVTKGGREREIEWYDKTLKDADGKTVGLLAIGQDITERKQAQEALQKMRDELGQLVSERTRELQTLYDVTAVATESLDLRVTLERSLERVLEALPCHAGAIHVLDRTAEVLRLAVHQGLPPSLLAQLDTLLADDDVMGSMLEHGQPVVMSDLATHPLVGHSAAANDLHMYVAAPMRARGMTLGVLHAFGEAGQECNVEDVALLTSVADHVGIAVDNAWLQKRAEQAAALEERQRLARELHDSVTQSVFSLTLFAEAARELAGCGKTDRIAQTLDEIDAIARQALKETRLMIYQMRPPALEQEGIVGALRRRLDVVEGRLGIEARVLTDTLVELPAAVEEELYHIAQEALNNALRHAAATYVTVRIRSEGEHLVLEVIDNGWGFDLNAVRDRGGMGLRNMRERAERLRGTLTILTKPDQGTTIQAKVSLAVQADPARANQYQ